MHKDTKNIPNKILMEEIRILIEEGKIVYLRVRGNSMRIFIENLRDKVLLSKCKRKLRVGDVVLAQIPSLNGIWVLHRIIKIKDSAYILKGDGNIRTIEKCGREDIMAIAIGFIRKNRTKIEYTNERKWKIYTWIWLHSMFLRRYVLAFYRRIWIKVFPIKIDMK